MVQIIPSKNFERSYQRLVQRQTILKKRIKKTILLLSENPEHPSLRLHKLTQRGHYSISVNMSIRIICYFEKDSIYLLEIGTHDEVYST